MNKITTPYEFISSNSKVNTLLGMVRGDKARALLNEVIVDAMYESRGEAYREGVTTTLDELSTIFDGIEETDLWAEYMNEGNN